MANTTLTADIVAAEAVSILDNELVMAKQVYRGYENEFSKKVNGYATGESIRVRIPTDFTVRTNRTMAVQPVTERSINITVDQEAGVDFEFTSTDLTLDIKELGERVMKPMLVQLANHVDQKLMELYKDVPSWVGTPGQLINAYTDFAKGPERLDEFAVPTEGRSAVLSPADHWGLVGTQTGLYIQDAAKGAYRKGSLGEIGGVETFMAQNVPTHTVGDWTPSGSAVEIDGALNPHTKVYTDVLTNYTQTITVDGFSSSAPAPAVGDVFTIEGVYAVNPVTKASLAPILRQFVVTAIAENSGNEVDITFTPPIITQASSTPAFATCYVSASDTDLDGHDVTPVGTSSTGYRQNMVFRRDAFALVMVPMVKPPGAVEVGRQTYKGTSVRVIPVYDGINDVSKWRCDILFGRKTVDPRQATRLSGT